MRRPNPAAALVLVAALLTAGCTTLATVPPVAAGESAALEPGDRVRVTFRNGDTEEFRVTRAAADGLVAEDGATRPYAEITQIEKRGTHGVRTTLLVVALTGGVLFLLAGIYAASGGFPL